MATLFISYTQADRRWAEWIAWHLERDGHSTIVQAWDFRPGSNFVLAMQAALAQSEHTIAVLSRAYLQASYPQAEWAATFARDPTGRQSRLIPVRVDDCEPPDLLRPIVYIDLNGYLEDAARRALSVGVRSALDDNRRRKPDEPPAFPTLLQGIDAAFRGVPADVGARTAAPARAAAQARRAEDRKANQLKSHLDRLATNSQG